MNPEADRSPPQHWPLFIKLVLAFFFVSTHSSPSNAFSYSWWIKNLAAAGLTIAIVVDGSIAFRRSARDPDSCAPGRLIASAVMGFFATGQFLAWLNVDVPDVFFMAVFLTYGAFALAAAVLEFRAASVRNRREIEAYRERRRAGAKAGSATPPLEASRPEIA